MLPSALTNNEVKDRAGVEVEFNRWNSDERKVEFAKVGEVPSLPRRLIVSHQETGEGTELVRRSAAIVNVYIVGTKSGKIKPIQALLKLTIPQGDIDDYNTVKDALAYLLSSAATTGAGTTVLFDCSGTVADALINGSM